MDRVESQTFIVFGSYGECVVDAESGRIKDMRDESSNANCAEYQPIVRFDVGEWLAAYPGEELVGNRVDILDLGYVLRNGTYEPPATDWRAEFRATTQDKELGIAAQGVRTVRG